MHGDEKSDRPVVPASPPNKAGQAVAEAGEGSGRGKENAASATRPGHRAGLSVPGALDRVRRVATRDSTLVSKPEALTLGSVRGAARAHQAKGCPYRDLTSYGA